MEVNYPAQYHTCLSSHHLIYKDNDLGWIICVRCHRGDFLRQENSVLELIPMKKDDINEALFMIDEDDIHDPWL